MSGIISCDHFIIRRNGIVVNITLVHSWTIDCGWKDFEVHFSAFKMAFAFITLPKIIFFINPGNKNNKTVFLLPDDQSSPSSSQSACSPVSDNINWQILLSWRRNHCGARRFDSSAIPSLTRITAIITIFTRKG